MAEHAEEEHEEEREEEEEEVQQDEQDKPAEVQGGAASQATAAVPASQGTNHLGASPAAPLMLLPAQRCSAVAATLSKLQLSSEQVGCATCAATACC